MTRIPVNPELLTWARERAGWLVTLALAGLDITSASVFQGGNP